MRANNLEVLIVQRFGIKIDQLIKVGGKNEIWSKDASRDGEIKLIGSHVKIRCTVQAIHNITNFLCKKSYKFIRISYLDLCTKFMKNLSTNSHVNSHMNSCTNSCLKATFLKKRCGGSISIINIIDLPV